MKVLYIGGTGIISSACSEVVVSRGADLFHLRRGRTERPVPPGIRVLRGDARDPSSVRSALGEHRFDVVVDFIAFTPDHIALDIDLFRERTSQFVFISSASAYVKPPTSLPITESTPLKNPFWPYSRAKIACEEALITAYREQGFPMTIVRPSHTYDCTLFPCHGGYTAVDRMRRGKPVVVHGDGTSLWTLTHHLDFARAFVGLLGNPRAVGEAFHITSDEWLTWDQIHRMLADAAGVATELVHVSSETIAAHDAEWGGSLIGDKAHSLVFDNAKVKRFVPGWEATIPFSSGAREIMAYYDEHPTERVVDAALDRTMDRLVDLTRLNGRGAGK
jgi:nucleoside-diphosphate-sugar epimerase